METVQIRDEDVLKWILGQRFRATRKKLAIEARKKAIAAEQDGMDEPAGIAAMVEEMNDRMKKQQARVNQAIIRVMDIIDYLPEDSLEKEICEYRHIDMMSWGQIEAAVPMSRSQCNNRYNGAIQMLLQNARVKEITISERENYRFFTEQKSEVKKWKKKMAEKKPAKKIPGNLFGNFTTENKAQENETNKKAGISAAEYMGIFQIAHRLAGGKGVALHWRYMGQFIEAHLEASKADHQEQGQA